MLKKSSNNKKKKAFLKKKPDDTLILQMREAMDIGGRAKVLDTPKLDQGKNLPYKEIEKIVKTTDSMQIVAKSFKNSSETDTRNLSEASKAILRSYDLAVRKIKSTYNEVLETKKEIGLEFLTVQIMIRHYEEFPNMHQILRVLNLFVNEVENLLGYGKGIWFSNELVIEAADYINKMIPVARLITPDAVIVNMMRWDEVADMMVKQNKIAIKEKTIITTLVAAINSNIRNGYFLKLGNLLISRIRPQDPECMILFSGETILRLNKIYSQQRARRKHGAVNKSNYLNKFMLNPNFQKERDKLEKERVDEMIRLQKERDSEKEQLIREREIKLTDPFLEKPQDPNAKPKTENEAIMEDNFEDEISEMTLLKKAQKLEEEKANEKLTSALTEQSQEFIENLNTETQNLKIPIEEELHQEEKENQEENLAKNQKQEDNDPIVSQMESLEKTLEEELASKKKKPKIWKIKKRNNKKAEKNSGQNLENQDEQQVTNS